MAPSGGGASAAAVANSAALRVVSSVAAAIREQGTGGFAIYSVIAVLHADVVGEVVPGAKAGSVSRA